MARDMVYERRSSMEKTKKMDQSKENPAEEQESGKISETWAQETIEDLDDFIESQGVYIRQ